MNCVKSVYTEEDHGEKTLHDEKKHAILAAVAPSAMIVDDNPMVCNATAAVVADFGYSVQLFYEGGNAFARFQHSPCDLLVTDYEMPEMNGLQLSRQIKALFPQTRIVIMTGLGRTSMSEEMGNPNIDAWLFKPFNMEEIKNVLFSIGLPYTQGRKILTA